MSINTQKATVSNGVWNVSKQIENKVNYRMARKLGTDSEFERIVETDCPMDEYCQITGPDDMFRLEYSGWQRHIEFAMKD